MQGGLQPTSLPDLSSFSVSYIRGYSGSPIDVLCRDLVSHPSRKSLPNVGEKAVFQRRVQFTNTWYGEYMPCVCLEHYPELALNFH
jgi:hypothetical protein